MRSAGMCMMSESMNLMEPERERSRPERVLSVVDFPAPFAPMRATISPSFTSKETFLMAWMAPYHTLMLYTDSITPPPPSACPDRPR